jgi:hypothetical protein
MLSGVLFFESLLMSLYSFVGPPQIRMSADFETPRHEVKNAAALLQWARQMDGAIKGLRDFVFTYVVLPEQRLFVADRRSEHVACARGDAVLTAGELFVSLVNGRLQVDGASNLSTGYCPEPGSWRALQLALEGTDLGSLEGFEPSFEFRRCEWCEQNCLIKDEVFECPGCNVELPQHWNFAQAPHYLSTDDRTTSPV